VLEHLDLRGSGDYAALGRSLAIVHSTRGESFGWRRTTTLKNAAAQSRARPSWSDFWREARIVPQLELGRKNGFGTSLLGKGEQLVAALPQLLSGRAPAASLVHGDLWSGNSGFLADGTPVLFAIRQFIGETAKRTLP